MRSGRAVVSELLTQNAKKIVAYALGIIRGFPAIPQMLNNQGRGLPMEIMIELTELTDTELDLVAGWTRRNRQLPTPTWR